MEKEPIVYAFIDGQNLRMGVKNDIYRDKAKKVMLYEGWNLNYKKFYQYLKDKYGVTKAYIFMGDVPEYRWLPEKMRKIGYDVVLKPTIPYKEEGNNKTKGNVDAELVLYASALTYDQYDRAVVVSGDGDFLCLLEYLDAENKLLKILAPSFRYSRLLNKFGSRVDIIGNKKSELGKNPRN